MRTLIIATLVLVALSGCFGGGSDLSQAEAEERVESAASDFSRALTQADAGDMRAIRGTMNMAPTEDSFGIGGTATFDMEWGQGGTMMVSMEMENEGFPFKFASYCGPDRTIVQWMGQTYESRGEGLEECELAAGDTGDLEDFAIQDLEAEDAQIKIHNDGTITATVEDDNGTFVLHINKAGRLTKVEMSAEGVTGTFDIEYGAKKVIEFPTATQKLPASLGGWGYYSTFDEEYIWTSSGWGAAYPNGEFEIRVMQDDQVVATFTPGQSGTEAGFTFTFSDDGDGMFGSNDTFTIRSPAWTESHQYDVVVWDLWADRDVEDNPMPGPLGLLALLAAVLIRRRQ